MPGRPRSLLGALALTSVVASGAAFAQATTVAGSWDLVMRTPIGDRRATMTVTPRGSTYTIDFRQAAGPGADPIRETIAEIRIEGSSFSFKRSVEIEQGLIELNYAGTVDGDALTGKVNSQFGTFDLNGTRANAD